MNWTTDNTPEILAFIRAHRLAIDPLHRGECARLADDKYVRRYYFARNGITLEALAEALWDARLANERATPGELLDALDVLFFGLAEQRAKGKRPGRRRANRRDEDDAVRRARNARSRKFQCPACGQISYGSRNTTLRCGVCLEMALASAPPAVVAWINENAPTFKRMTPLPEEILLAAATNAEECAA